MPTAEDDEKPINLKAAGANGLQQTELTIDAM
jgi:hypothetical protein